MFSYNKPLGELHGLILEIIATIALTGAALSATLTSFTPVTTDFTSSLTGITGTLAVAYCTALPLLLTLISIVFGAISTDAS
jgi:hypothetical protein